MQALLPGAHGGMGEADVHPITGVMEHIHEVQKRHWSQGSGQAS